MNASSLFRASFGLLALFPGSSTMAQSVKTAPAMTCVPFSSHGRMLAGQSWTARGPGDLVVGVRDDSGHAGEGVWALTVGPADDVEMNYLDVMPPLRFRPHVYVGMRYMDARESVSFPREIEVVTTREDYRSVGRLLSGDDDDVMDRIAALARGVLRLKVDDYALAKIALPGWDGPVETLQWIVFSGEMCVPR